MTSTSLALSIPFVGIMLLAAASDLSTRRIPNALTVAGMVAAPVLWGILAGPAVALASIVGGALAFLVGLTLFALGAVGGGDAKLLVVTGAFVGPARLVNALLLIGIAGGVLAFALALGRGRLLQTLARAWQLSLHLTTLGRAGAARHVEAPEALTIPYGLAIAAGSLVTWFALAPTPFVP
jgi:prepilin peptidase CpaA